MILVLHEVFPQGVLYQIEVIFSFYIVCHGVKHSREIISTSKMFNSYKNA